MVVVVVVEGQSDVAIGRQKERSICFRCKALLFFSAFRFALNDTRAGNKSGEAIARYRTIQSEALVPYMRHGSSAKIGVVPGRRGITVTAVYL